MVGLVRRYFKEVKEMRNSDDILRALVTSEPHSLRKGFDVTDADFDNLFSKARDKAVSVLDLLRKQLNSLQETFSLAKQSGC
eukprot:1034617-Amphidinium_carterae.1